MVIQWVTHVGFQGVPQLLQKDDLSFVQYSSTSGATTNKTKGKASTYTLGGWLGIIHTVLLSDLIPETKYYYKVGCDLGWSTEYSFCTRNNDVCVIGDFELNQKVTLTKTLRENFPHFDWVIHAGDVTYAKGNQKMWDEVSRVFQPVTAEKPIMITVGNHENEKPFRPGNGFAAFINRFKMPRDFWFSYDRGYVHFVFISTEHHLDPASEQAKWLEDDFTKANAHRDQVPWIIVVAHKPYYSTNISSGYLRNKKYLKVKNALESVLYKHQVDVVINGHLHAYERTYPIYQDKLTNTGPVYIIVGTAGAHLDHNWGPPQDFSAYRAAKHGFGLLHIHDPSSLTWIWKRTCDNKVWDQFTLKRSTNNNQRILEVTDESKIPIEHVPHEYDHFNGPSGLTKRADYLLSFALSS